MFSSSAQAQTLLTHSTTKFQQAQRALEHQIIARQVQLTLLGTEVANASNLTPTDQLRHLSRPLQRAGRSRHRRHQCSRPQPITPSSTPFTKQ